MTRRVLLVERDESGRHMMDRVLSAAGFDTDGVAAIEEAHGALDRDEYQLAIVDELAGTGASLDEVRSARKRWPRLPVVVTGSVLTAPVLLELMRLGVIEALPKPFSPAELRDVVTRVVARFAPSEVDALDYAAALAAAREALARCRWELAELQLRRALRIAPLDAEATALLAVRSEAGGDDRRASQLYRAALVLSDEESAPPPDPREGLARIHAYADARPTTSIDESLTAWLIDEMNVLDEPGPEGAHVVVFTVGVVRGPDAPLFFRASNVRSFAVSLGDASVETFAYVLDRLRAPHVHVTESTRARLDLPRLASLRTGARSANLGTGAPR